MDNRIVLESASRLALATTPDAIARARRIRLLLFDVDGVLTDGSLWYFPSGDGVTEVKAFSAHDGIGIALARRAGLKTGVITKRRSQSLALRARDLRMDYIHQGIDRKLDTLEQVWRESGIAPEETCCMGDDLVDLPMLRRSGLAAAPADARHEVKVAAHFVSAQPGGRGAARDLIDFVLAAQDRLEATIKEYVADPDSDYLEASQGNSHGKA